MMIKHAVIFLMLTKHVAILYELSIHLNVVARDHDNFFFIFVDISIYIMYNVYYARVFTINKGSVSKR